MIGKELGDLVSNGSLELHLNIMYLQTHSRPVAGSATGGDGRLSVRIAA